MLPGGLILGPIRNAFAQEPGRPEHEDQDQHEEREHLSLIHI